MTIWRTPGTEPASRRHESADSPSTRDIDRGPKKTLYEQVFRTRDYVVYDPFDPGSLEGWYLNVDSVSQPIATNSQGWLWCRRLNLWLGLWQGSIEGDTCSWLRFYDATGSLVLLPEESAQQQLDRERQRADRLAEQLRQLGLDPELLWR